MSSASINQSHRRRPSGGSGPPPPPYTPPLLQDVYANKPLPPKPGLQPSNSKAYLLNRKPGASQVYIPPSQSQASRVQRDRSKPPTCQPFGQHSVLARASSQPVLHTYKSPNSSPFGRRAAALQATPNAPAVPAAAAGMTVTPQRKKFYIATEEVKPISIIRDGERTLFGTSKASPPKSAGRAGAPTSGSSTKIKVPRPREIKVDFAGVWARFVQRTLHPEADLEALIQEKTEHPLGKASAEFSPFHALPVLPSPTKHIFSVKFNSHSGHLAKWRARAGLEDLEPNEEYMEELFWQIVSCLETEYGWLRHVHDEVTSMDPTARHYVLRPGIHYSKLPRPSSPLKDRIDSLYLPKGPKMIVSRTGNFWSHSVAQQFSHVRAHRHSTLGLVFHQWMHNERDVVANADALPPPVWFMLYAMQAAYPGLFVICEETENEQVHQTIERGLPPYEILADRGCGPFFMGLLGEKGYTDVCEASLDARTSTIVDMLIKGSVRPRKRTLSNSSGLPPMPDEPKSGFRRLLRRPSWLGRWQSS
ncbi:hypothetical protein FRC01_006991 [Tulasnella sp. 417]|nr:hypothetical protein FRC01_006991 [Tulasnella sp. 417]